MIISKILIDKESRVQYNKTIVLKQLFYIEGEDLCHQNQNSRRTILYNVQ